MDYRTELFDEAELAQFNGQSKETVKAVRRIAVHFSHTLDLYEKMFIADAYKIYYEELKTVFEILKRYEANNDSITENERNMIADSNIDDVKEEMRVICYDFIQLLEAYLIPQSKTDKSLALLLSLKGDYKRYLLKTTDNNITISELTDDASVAYDLAYQKTEHLNAADPIKLGIALNYAVFIHDVLRKSYRACYLLGMTISTSIVAYRNGHRISEESLSLLFKCQHNLVKWRLQSGAAVKYLCF